MLPTKVMVPIIVLGIMFFEASDAGAQDYYEHCNKVLEGDLFNKQLSNTSSQSELREFAWSMFLTMSEDEAYQAFERQSSSSKGQGVSGGVSYMGIGLSGGSSYSRQNTQAEFREDYRKMKSLNQGARQNESSAKTSNVSNYSVLTRDANSINAWEECVSKSPVPGMYVYGSRGDDGNPYVKVLWSPGNFGAATPSIQVSFVEAPGISVQAKKQQTLGTGAATFSVKTTEDNLAYELHVNGAFLLKGTPVSNWSERALIPPKRVPLNYPSIPGSFASASENLYVYVIDNLLDMYCYGGERQNEAQRTADRNMAGKVGNGWDFEHVFSAGGGVIYGVKGNGDLYWYRHEGRNDCSYKWSGKSASKIGNGWFFKHIFSGGNGVIYGVKENGEVFWYRHDGRDDGSFKWASGTGVKVNKGWEFRHIFSGENGVIYGIKDNGDLHWYRHDGRSDGSPSWAENSGKKINMGWNFEHVFSGNYGTIYGVKDNGELIWYRHEGRNDGSSNWDPKGGKKIGSGWYFKEILPGG